MSAGMHQCAFCHTPCSGGHDRPGAVCAKCWPEIRKIEAEAKAQLPPLALDLLLTDDQRRTVTVDDHLHFRRSLATDDCGRDEIDRELDEHLQIDPYVTGTNNRRSDKELARMLSLIDNLPISDAGKEGPH